MFGPARRALNTYTTVGVETSVQSADPLKLVVMLYEGALAALVNAKLHMKRREIAGKGNALSKAIAIIENGLKASLDISAGGHLAAQLASLYDYMCGRLVVANLENRPEIIDEVGGLLNDLKGAWEQIGQAANETCPPAQVTLAAVNAAYDKA
jgi:flagellar protein FliS